MKIRNALIAMMLMVCGLAQAQMQNMTIPADTAFRVGKLANGLTYYIRYNNWPEHRANFYIAQKVGSLEEDESQRGLAHFLEHMAFNGSDNFKGNDLIEWCRSKGIEFGGDLNAYTAIDQTVYNINNVNVEIPGALDSCLLILHDWSHDLLLEDKDSKQASAAAFNPYGQYESCTFTVANKAEYVDAADEIFNVRSEKALKNPVKLNVFADRVLVGEFWLDNKMEPLTVTVPIFKCHQLMFWMECGDTRSGQYVFYDLKLSKAPCDIAIPTEYSSGNYDYSHNGASETATEVNNNPKTSKKGKKAKQRVTWEVKNYSGDSAVDGYLKDITELWGKTSKYVEGDYEMPKISETWVQAKDSSVYKCLSFVNSRRQRLSISSMIETLEKRINEGKNIQASISLARLGVASATLGVATLFSIDKTIYFSKKVKEGPKALTQCEDDISACISLAKAQIDAFNAYRSAAIEVDGKTSSDTVLILRPEKDDNVPNTFERLEYFNF